MAVIEAGNAGNLFVSAAEEVFVPLYNIVAVDRTGAGDALAGALAVAIVEGWPLRTAAEFATAAAALTTRSHGAQTSMPDRAAIRQMLERAAAVTSV